MSDIETTQGWALLELMGHRQVVGFVTRSSDPLVRVDVPEVDGKPAFTQEYGKASIYCISWIGESEAKALLRRYKPEPPVAYMLPTALPGENPAPPVGVDDYEDDDTDDDDASDDAPDDDDDDDDDVDVHDGHAREDVPALIAEVERLRTTITALSPLIESALSSEMVGTYPRADLQAAIQLLKRRDEFPQAARP